MAYNRKSNPKYFLLGYTHDELIEILERAAKCGAITEEQVKQWINEAQFGDTDFTGYATESWVDGKGYLTEIPSEYVTDAELTNKGYATESYVIGLLGDIDTVLDQINGEVV